MDKKEFQLNVIQAIKTNIDTDVQSSIYNFDMVSNDLFVEIRYNHEVIYKIVFYKNFFSLHQRNLVGIAYTSKIVYNYEDLLDEFVFFKELILPKYLNNPLSNNSPVSF